MPKSLLVICSLVLGLMGLAGREAAAFPASVAPALQAQELPSAIVQAGSRRHHHAGGKHHRHYRYRYKHRNYGWNDWRYSYYGWRRPYSGYPCNGWSFYCGSYYGYGYVYDDDFWGPGYDSGIVLTYRPYRPYRHVSRRASRHVAWCQERYRSYNARSNSWVAYSGKIRQCVSPYSR